MKNINTAIRLLAVHLGLATNGTTNLGGRPRGGPGQDKQPNMQK